ncbi:hypothetical protein AGMMS50268_22910 [Spirochaetia bacterium]|nr:hypothetical protein AGMMS50268_22910 [Spirochaetia bacterium]
MKKSMVQLILLVLPVAFGALACSSTPAPNYRAPQESSAYPGEVNAVIGKNAPEDVLVGIGYAKMAQKSRSLEFSERRARDAIVRTISTLGQGMADDYFVGAEGTEDQASFQETISTQLSRADVSGATIEVQAPDPDGGYWTVVYFGKAKAAIAVSNAAQALKNLAPNAAAAMSAKDRMEKAFAKIEKTAEVKED